MRFDLTFLAVGTGVLYRNKDEFFIVTAWHNVTGRNSETLAPISKQLAIPNNLIAYIPCRMYSKDSVNQGYERIPVTIELTKNEQSIYYVHQESWPRIDVAAIPLDLNKLYLSEYEDSDGVPKNHNIFLNAQPGGSGAHGWAIEAIQDCEFANDNEASELSSYLYASDDIFILGYPKGITDRTGLPIWKRATVASNPEFGWNGNEMFLIDCASREGMSGAPAIFYDRKGMLHLGSTLRFLSKPACLFHGIYVGREQTDSLFEAQIGRVWHRSVIDNIIDMKLTQTASEFLSSSVSSIARAINEQWPKESYGYAQKLLNSDAYYLDGFLYSVMKRLNGLANPTEVRQQILEEAKIRAIKSA